MIGVSVKGVPCKFKRYEDKIGTFDGVYRVDLDASLLDMCQVINDWLPMCVAELCSN